MATKQAKFMDRQHEAGQRLQSEASAIETAEVASSHQSFEAEEQPSGGVCAQSAASTQAASESSKDNKPAQAAATRITGKQRARQTKRGKISDRADRFFGLKLGAIMHGVPQEQQFRG